MPVTSGLGCFVKPVAHSLQVRHRARISRSRLQPKILEVVAEKTGAAQAKYNRASQLVAELLDIWRRRSGRKDAYLKNAIDSINFFPDDAERTYDRSFEHFSRLVSQKKI